MKFNYYQLGHRQTGDVVEVKLAGSAANVRLLDSTNYQNYKSGRKHRYYGGLFKQSPAHIPIPHSGTWYVVVDMQGLRGTSRSSIRVIPKETLSPLPEYNARPLTPLVQPVHAASDSIDSDGYFDVFISHAAEDKEKVARPLAAALEAQGLRVWYDEIELKIGDSLRRKIDNGIARSRFGVVIISPSFFAKGWPQYELDGLVSKAVTGEQALLPLWHDVTKAEVIEHSPSLADKVARSTSQFTIEEIAAEIADVIESDLHQP